MHEGSWMEQQQVSLIIISIPSDVISVLALSTFKQLHADFWVHQCGKFPPAGFRGKTYSVLQNAVLKTNYVGLLSVKTGQCLQEADSLTARLWSPTFSPPFFLSFCFFLRWWRRFSCQSAYLAILFGFQPNANRQTDNINEGNGVGFFSEKLEECHSDNALNETLRHISKLFRHQQIFANNMIVVQLCRCIFRQMTALL